MNRFLAPLGLLAGLADGKMLLTPAAPRGFNTFDSCACHTLLCRWTHPWLNFH